MVYIAAVLPVFFLFPHLAAVIFSHLSCPWVTTEAAFLWLPDIPHAYNLLEMCWSCQLEGCIGEIWHDDAQLEIAIERTHLFWVQDHQLPDMLFCLAMITNLLDSGVKCMLVSHWQLYCMTKVTSKWLFRPYNLFLIIWGKIMNGEYGFCCISF